jgi:hypothetical protein
MIANDYNYGLKETRQYFFEENGWKIAKKSWYIVPCWNRFVLQKMKLKIKIYLREAETDA